MPEEIIQEQEVNNEVDLVDDITAWKANTVSREQFDRVQAERDRFARALMNNEQVEVEAPEKPDINELRLELYTEDVQRLSDVEIAAKTLQLRKALIDDGEIDPFVPIGQQTGPEDSDFATAERVAQVLQECVDYSNGDNTLFLAELNRRTMDINPVATRANARRR